MRSELPAYLVTQGLSAQTLAILSLVAPDTTAKQGLHIASYVQKASSVQVGRPKLLAPATPMHTQVKISATTVQLGITALLPSLSDVHLEPTTKTSNPVESSQMGTS